MVYRGVPLLVLCGGTFNNNNKYKPILGFATYLVYFYIYSLELKQSLFNYLLN